MARRDWHRHDKTPNTEIFHFEANGKRVVDEEFHSDGGPDAIEHWRQWKMSHLDSADNHYWGLKKDRFGSYGLWHCDGVVTYGYTDVQNWFVDRAAKWHLKLKEAKDDDKKRKVKCLRKIARIRKRSRCTFLQKLVGAWIGICDWCSWWLKDKWIEKFRDIKYNIKRNRYWKKHHQDYEGWWSLELHLLKTLRWNLGRLNEEGMGIAPEFIQEVLDEMNKGNPNYDPEKAFADYCGGGKNESQDVFDKAIQRQKDTYNRIIHLIDLYTYYYNDEIDDKPVTEANKTPDMQKVFLEGSYDEEDFRATMEKGKAVWNEIWEMVKKYGQGMGD